MMTQGENPQKQVMIKINDVTLREGDQAPLTSFNREEKMIIALMLQELGVDNIEAGFASSRADYENIKGVLEVIDENGPIVATLGRATKTDTTASINVTKGYKNARIHIFLATSDEHIKAKFGNRGATIEEKRDWLIEQITNEVGRAKKYKDTENESLEIEFSPEDATGNALTKKEDGKRYLDFTSEEFNFLVKACETAIRNGATIINTPDTLGNLLPHETEKFFKELSSKLAHLKNEGYDFALSSHIHNDLGMASANAISAIRGGATQIELTINGIGERTGNTSLHEIIGLIGEKSHAILDDGEVVISPKIQTQLVGPVSEFVKSILNLNKDLQTPFIGPLSDVDGSGVHNAAQNVYGGSKNKARYGGSSMPEFFSPRGGANQIISMLKQFGVKEDKNSQIIASVTATACSRAEEVKALYAANIFSLYQKEAENYEIKTIDIDGNKIRAQLSIYGKDVIIEGEGEGENGVINGLVNGINSYLGEKIVDVENINIVNKPSLRGAYDAFLENTSKAGTQISEKVQGQIEDILSEKEKNHKKSKQLGVAHVKLSVNGKPIDTVSSASNVDYAIAKAIIEGALSVIIKKTTQDKESQ